MRSLSIVRVNPENVSNYGLFCLKNPANPGFQKKLNWFKKEYEKGLRLNILVDDKDGQIGFIEYTPIEHAWRPVRGKNMTFIHCIAIYKKDEKGKGMASLLIEDCMHDAMIKGHDGVAVVTSEGTWMAGKGVFLKNRFENVESKDRFNLLYYKFKSISAIPEFLNWEDNIKGLDGWHLIYSDQCPLHEKSVLDLANTAKEHKIDLNIEQISSSSDMKNMPSGFGVFNLVHNGKLLSDHYISSTRFKTIIKKEKELVKT